MKSIRNIIVTSALPYANGDLHLGHILEFIQADIWVRYHRLLGNNCIYISGDDSHGTPIMLKSVIDNIEPEEIVKRYYSSHKQDLFDFNISLNNYYTTHSSENTHYSHIFFNELLKNGFIYTDNVDQFYDSVKGFYLPDRYVKGKCPRCMEDDQYGDVCEKCSFRYNSLDLINPVSVISGSKPILKNSKHYFFKLKLFEDFLFTWCKSNIVQVEVLNKLNEWFALGLKDWDISRDSPYFGILIPGEKDKYFYVWLDAPIGYISSFYNFCSFNKSVDFDSFWKSDSSYELHHFIGKDISYFHTLFWPALLKGSGFRLPTSVHVHGFLTINGRKMSKSDGTFITAKSYIKHFSNDLLRYYFASKLNSSINDIDFNWFDFCSKVNTDLVGKFVNILSRVLRIIDVYFDNYLCDFLINTLMFDKFMNIRNEVLPLYESKQYSKIIFLLMKYVEDLNLYIDFEKPWMLVKSTDTFVRAHNVCTLVINLFLLLVLNIKPIMPSLASDVEKILNLQPLNWYDFNFPVLSHKINSFNVLIRRIDLNVLKEFKI